MDALKKILAPTDFSELSRHGIRYALTLAGAVGAEVTVCHVVGYGDLVEYQKELIQASRGYQATALLQPSKRYERALERFLETHFADLLPSVRLRRKVLLGAPESSIVDLARRDGSDLIVISTHGRTGLSHVLFGSVTEKVVRRAPCPVLSIHPARDEAGAEKLAAVA